MNDYTIATTDGVVIAQVTHSNIDDKAVAHKRATWFDQSKFYECECGFGGFDSVEQLIAHQVAAEFMGIEQIEDIDPDVLDALCGAVAKTQAITKDYMTITTVWA